MNDDTPGHSRIGHAILEGPGTAVQVEQYRKWSITDRLIDSGEQHSRGDLPEILFPDLELVICLWIIVGCDRACSLSSLAFDFGEAAGCIFTHLENQGQIAIGLWWYCFLNGYTRLFHPQLILPQVSAPPASPKGRRQNAPDANAQHKYPQPR